VKAGPKIQEWYFFKASVREGQQAGPFSSEQLHSLAQAGTLLPVDLVWNPRVSQWVPARQIGEIFSEASAGVQGSYPGTARPGAPSTGRGRSWLAWVIPLIALVIVGGGLGVYFGFFWDGSESTASDQTTTTLEATAVSVAATTTSQVTTTTEAPAAWADLHPVGAVPSARYAHSMAYASGTGKVMLFGGWDASAGVGLNDIWAYDHANNTWTNLKPAGGVVPSVRCRCSMVYDEAAGRLLLFGGLDDASHKCFNDTWAYDEATNTWMNLKPTGAVPSARAFSCMVYDEDRHKVILFGGWDESASIDFNDTWAYDPAANTWTQLTPVGAVPSARDLHQMVYDPASGKVILFGGDNDSTETGLNDTWAYDPVANTWTDLSPAGTVPSGRGWFSMVYDEAHGQVVLFGGWDGTYANDTWAYDPAANKWAALTAVGAPPSGRSSHCMVYDSGASEVILFGGANDNTSYDDTWAYVSAP
jgi:N-acetylneuraminic acid mutarotase